METELIKLPKRTRIHRSASFKSQLVELATQSGASVSGIAVSHGINPNLLRRWIRASEPSSSVPTRFVPVTIEPVLNHMPESSTSKSAEVEVMINQGNVHIRLAVNTSQMTALGLMLREVLK
jgi:transposase